MVGQVSTAFPPERVKLIRALKKMTQAEFALAYGLSVTTLSRLENGEAGEILLPTLGKLLEAARDVGA